MKDTKDIVACVIDHGLYLPLARRLAEEYKAVFYTTPQERVFRKVTDCTIGTGFEDDRLYRVDSLWEVKDQCDLFVFPDIGYGAEQMDLVSQGKSVWGHHGADIIETDRGEHLRILKELGMPVPDYVVCHGMTDLQEYLQDAEDKYIKVSLYRGDFETMHWRNWFLDSAKLDLVSGLIGPAKELLTFYVFDPIDADFEGGIDTYSIDGKSPSTVLHGIEYKDRAYIGAAQSIDTIPAVVRDATDKFNPILGRYKARTAFSTEVRVVGEEGFFTDPTIRFPSPPFQMMLDMFENLPEIIAAGADGLCIEPVIHEPYGAQALIYLQRSDAEHVLLDINPEIKQFCKFGMAWMDGDNMVLNPSPNSEFGPMLGWLTATGDTMQDAVDNLVAEAELLPDNVKCDPESLANLLTQIQDAKDDGVPIGLGAVPEPSSVISNE